jgi:hypothetical protein
MRTKRQLWMWGLACAPAAWLALFGLFLLRARMALGRWPEPYHPDPKDLGFDLHYIALVAGVPLLFAAVLTAAVLTPFVAGGARRYWIPITAVVCLAVAVALARLDPGGVFTWLGD